MSEVHTHHDHHHSHPHAHGEACGCGHPHDTPGNLPHDASALVSARALTFRRHGRSILSNINLDVHAREIVTLIGPNGAGKTTLVKLILGIEKPDSGQVVLPVSTRIGYVPQRFDIDRAMPMTVARFLALGLSVSNEAVLSALRDSGVERCALQQLSHLSGGETQRVLIARALLRNPNLLVLDEPARGVDFVGEADLYDLIGRIRDARGLGVLLISHDLHVVMAKSDRVICLNGHVCCSGQPETVAQHAEYARLFGPKEAQTLGVYLHHHDHEHDISGVPHPSHDLQRGGKQ
ncbi:MAG: metal ABC transporter ATP-binding protein [Hyphomicrobium sp.]|nr:metal ABC transporter ATP-binding protein [Hyphomicrobium sp.]